MKTTHYVYELRHPITDEFYIGVRSCIVNSIDDNYMGSMVSWNVDKTILKKTIIDDTFLNRESANLFEIELLKSYINNPLNRNYHIPSIGFCCYGIKRSDEYKKKLSNLKKLQYKLDSKMLKNNRIAQKNRWNESLKKIWSDKMKSINSNKEYRDKQIQSSQDRMKPILQFDKLGNLIKEYCSIREAAKELNIDKTCISRNCNGKYKSAFGYVWKFKE
jgi:hypothetical protein